MEKREREEEQTLAEEPESKKKHENGQSTGRKKINESGEPTFELSEYRKITVRKWKGKTLVDIREFYRDKNTGELKHGKTGISLSLEQWNVLKSLMGDIDEEVEKL